MKGRAVVRVRPIRRSRRPDNGAVCQHAGVLNRRARLDQIMRRDGALCVWCGRRVNTDLVRATTEHVVPRSKGGPSWIENELAACARCNSDRGHRGLAEFADECDGLGRDPDRGALVESLVRLDEAIAERGGQRRARRYIDHQLRRLRNQLS